MNDTTPPDQPYRGPIAPVHLQAKQAIERMAAAFPGCVPKFTVPVVNIPKPIVTMPRINHAALTIPKINYAALTIPKINYATPVVKVPKPAFTQFNVPIAPVKLQMGAYFWNALPQMKVPDLYADGNAFQYKAIARHAKLLQNAIEQEIAFNTLLVPLNQWYDADFSDWCDAARQQERQLWSHADRLAVRATRIRQALVRSSASRTRRTLAVAHRRRHAQRHQSDDAPSTRFIATTTMIRGAAAA